MVDTVSQSCRDVGITSVIACSRRSDSGARNEKYRERRKNEKRLGRDVLSLLSPVSFRFFLPSLSFACHHVNAWNRLNPLLQASTDLPSCDKTFGIFVLLHITLSLMKIFSFPSVSTNIFLQQFFYLVT